MYDLKRLQNKGLEMLQAIHDACEKLGIRYYIMYGTLLGAVRHNGFIPWDDDVDICMTREDYDIFIEKGQQYLPENFQIQHFTTEADCPNIYAKVRDCNTTFLSREHVDLDINHGIFVDVFPVERIKSSGAAFYLEYLRRKIFVVMNSCCDQAYVDSIIRKRSKVIGWFVHNVINKIFVQPSRSAFLKREDSRRRKLHEKGDDCAFLTVTPLKKTTIPYSVFGEPVLYQIDGKFFYGPKDYDFLLRSQYGNYMQLPPEDQRVTHQPILVDFEKGFSREEIKETEFIH